MNFSFFTTVFNIRNLCKMLLKGGLKHLHGLIKLLLERIIIGILNDFSDYQKIKIAA